MGREGMVGDRCWVGRLCGRVGVVVEERRVIRRLLI